MGATDFPCRHNYYQPTILAMDTNRANLTILLVAVLAPALLMGGCGQTGPLYLPAKAPAPQAAATVPKKPNPPEDIEPQQQPDTSTRPNNGLF